MAENLPLRAETVAFFESISGKTVRYAGPTRRILDENAHRTYL